MNIRYRIALDVLVGLLAVAVLTVAAAIVMSNLNSEPPSNSFSPVDSSCIGVGPCVLELIDGWNW